MANVCFHALRACPLTGFLPIDVGDDMNPGHPSAAPPLKLPPEVGHLMRTVTPRVALFALTLCASGQGYAQDMPTSQPRFLTIYREEVKIGRSAEHTKIESGWPAAFERAKSPDYYLAFVSMTGPNEAWFVVPQQSHASIAEGMKRDDADPVLSAELARLQRADAEVLTNSRTMQAMARPDLSQGNFPDLAKARFFEITWFRVRPGHEAQFDAAVKAYTASAKRAAPDASWRTYEIIAGAPSPTFLIFASVDSYADFDKMVDDGQKSMKGLTADEGTVLQKFAAEGMINSETNRFRVDPRMSYVSKAARAVDPAFWMPKKAPTRVTSQP